MAAFTVFYDANVLYPAELRNFLMHLALMGVFRAKWSADVHEEWIRNLLKNRPDLTREKLESTRQLMDKAAPMRWSQGINTSFLDFFFPTKMTRCGASLIVTSNLADFPPEALSPFDIEAQHPDEFILHLFDLTPGLVIEAAHNHRTSMKNPPKTVEEYLDSLESQGLTQTASALREYMF